MKSTIKIDYSGRGNAGVPVIKIVQPLEVTQSTLNEQIEDVRDRLISEFLHTPCMVNRNHVFRTDGYTQFPKETPEINITTISAVQEEDMLRFLKTCLLGRFVDYEIQCEMQRLKGEDISIANSTNHQKNTWVKINNFFNELSELVYSPDFTKQ